MLPALRSQLVYQVGIPLTQSMDREIEFAVKEPGGDFSFRTRAFKTFEDIIAALPHHDDVSIVHITNEIETTRFVLARQCEELAPFLAAHPNKPIANFAGPGLDFLRVIFARNMVRTSYVPVDVVAVVHWTRLLRDRVPAR